MVQAIIFDCFGVLIGRGFDETYRSAGGNPEADYDFIRTMLGKANLGIISQAEFSHEIAHHLGISVEVWRSAVKRAEQPDFEMLDYIEQLHASYKTAILSNANRGVVQHKLGEGCLNKCFDSVIVSAEIGRVKPDPEVYMKTAEQLMVSPEACVFIDDLSGYVEAAEKVGMKGIVYQNLSQLKTDLNQCLELKS